MQDEFISSSSTPFVDNPLFQIDVASRVVNASYLLGRYFSLAILPFQLSADYSFNQIPLISTVIPSFELFVAFCVIALIILSAIIFYRKKNISSLAILWFFITFALTSNVFFPIGTIFGERLAYLPSVGICLLLGDLINKQSGIISKSALTAFFFYYLLILIPRNNDWKNDLTLNNSQIHISPQSAKTQDNYGLVLLSQGKPQQALVHINNALDILPTYLPAKVSLAQTFEKLGDITKAKEIYHEIFSIDPHYKKALIGFIRLNLSLGDTKTAQEYINIVIKFHGEDFEVLIQEFTLFILKDEKLLANNLRNFLVKNFPSSQVVKDLIAEGINRGVLK